MSYRVHLTQSAQDQIFNQYAYIAIDQETPERAEEWLERAHQTVATLSDMPHRCPYAEEDAHKDYEIRKLAMDGFHFLFTVFEERKEAWVLATRGSGMEVNPARLPDDVETVIDSVRKTQAQRSGES